MMNIKNLSIGFIGAGRVGFTLGRYFYEKNLHLSGYFSNSFKHACEAAEFTHSNSYKTIKELAENSQVIFITAPDSCIYDIYLQLRKFDLRDKILCHCSGALSAEVFEDIESANAYGYSIHPAFAVSDKYNSFKKISNAFFTIEGSDKEMAVIKEIFKSLKNPYQIIKAKDKYKYHASLVMSSNLVIGLYHIALSLLEECGFSRFTAIDVLNPLFLNNAESLCKNGCVNALTGPVDRNDLQTVREHLSVLDNADLYKILSKELIKIANEKYPDRDYNELEKILNEEQYSVI
ncbi:MAG: DUF2520 domain-containing protein [Acetobacter sp.]|nr:DUF2520 domain-containing protein [Bacteroides sp.]MCM1340199.1 DUF2520 domain-containing protein [Acetobacter sp.]MCM1432849.1 DUF2520 domain-containing protein [Clostridiales bacterium]